VREGSRANGERVDGPGGDRQVDDEFDPVHGQHEQCSDEKLQAILDEDVAIERRAHVDGIHDIALEVRERDELFLPPTARRRPSAAGIAEGSGNKGIISKKIIVRSRTALLHAAVQRRARHQPTTALQPDDAPDTRQKRPPPPPGP
jgi:hypothetical protein